MTIMQTGTQKLEHKVLVDYYLKYPYKKVDYATPYPYVPVKEQVDDPKALTFKEWTKIIVIYYKYVFLYIAQGYTYRFSSAIGELRIIKYKSKRIKPNFEKILKEISKERGCTYGEAKKFVTKEHIKKYKHLNRHTDGYRWNLAWFKAGYNAKYQHYWSIILSRKIWRVIRPVVEKNIHSIKNTQWTGRNYRMS